MTAEITYDRRRFVGAAAMALAAAQLGPLAGAQSGAARLVSRSTDRPGSTTSLGPLKQIDAGLLNVGYAEAGPSHGVPVILLHGWPYDIYSFAEVIPILSA